MLLVALYENFLHPFVILLSLPLAAVGAIGGLVVTGQTLNMMSLIGMILLTGLVGKNAILLIDYTNTLRRRGRPRNEALLEAGPARLRPILMTTVTMIAALMPTALAIGEGSELRAPLAIVVIGGLTTSTLLTLVLIPAVFTLFDDLERFIVTRVLGRKEGAEFLPSVRSLEPVTVVVPEAEDQPHSRRPT
jgi:HAE1 family hydrophobic/amphiphilic exporter-1